MTYSTQPNRDSYATFYLILSVIGGLAALLALCGHLAFEDDAMVLIGNAFAVISMMVLKPSKDKDEFLNGLWHAGAGTAIVTMALWAMLGPTLAGFVDGVSGKPPTTRFPHEASFAVLTTGFFGGYLWRRLRGQA
ncbi:MAG: hypothetical protein AAFZ11_10130 [Pseudomonadota bacterium]